jgi:uncharacterized protein YegL
MKDVIDELGDFIDELAPDQKMKPVNHVAFLVDVSGSMIGKENFIADTFNEHLKVMKKQKDQDTFISLIFFNDIEKMVYYNQEVNSVDELVGKDIYISGSTALFDSLGNVINNFNNDVEKLRNKENNHSALVIVITDGADNVSRKYDYKRIKSLMSEMETYKTWTFTFAGVDFDVLGDYGNVINNVGNTMILNSSDPGRSLRSFSQSIGSYYNARNHGQTEVKDYYTNSNKTSDKETNYNHTHEYGDDKDKTLQNFVDQYTKF